MNTTTLARLAALALAIPLAGTAAAQELNTNALSENGWFSDDTRADGTGASPAGTNLISDTLTDDPEASLSGSAAADAEILDQVQFGPPPVTPPPGTHLGAVRLHIDGAGAGGKTQISHRKDDGVGHGPGSAFGPAFTAEFSWMGSGPPAITASLKFGLKTPDFGSTGTSTRTGENVWDKVLIYEPGQGNGKTADGTWQTETIDFTTGKWWFFDRTVSASSQSTPLSLADMSTSAVVYKPGKTIADAYALITDPTSIITSVQFGIGSNNPLGDVYVNQLVTSAYRPGITTTFGQPSPFDQDVIPDILFGSGNTNGGFTVDRQDGIELGLRSKQRFPAANVFNSNGDGTYTWNTGVGSVFPTAIWNFEWAVNTDYKGTSSLKLDGLTYEIGMDFDPGAATNYLSFDPITPGEVIPYSPAPPPTVFWDHAIGDNTTGNGGGTSAGDGPAYTALLGANNVAQQSWRMDFFDEVPFDVFDPTVPGFYDFYLAAFDGGNEVARTAITVIAVDGSSLTLEANPCQADAFPGTAGLQVEFELWLRNPDDLDLSGYQAFLAFDDMAMTYEGALSSYTSAPFDTNIQPIATAEVAPGELRLDGNAFFVPAASGDGKLATLVFTVGECETVSVDFDATQAFPNELSYLGSPVGTALLDSSDVLADDTAPVLAASPNITQPADAGSCTEAVVFFTAPTATDNCDPAPTVSCSPASGSTFPVGTTVVTCTATDACGNVSSSNFTVTVTATNAVDVIVELSGSEATSRCIYFNADSCSASTSEVLSFTGNFPAVAVATIEIPCGVWTSLCAKDEQHTKWASSPLMISGSKYVATLPLVLDGGDTDNDGDIDINDVTLFLNQFGDTATAGGCAWSGVRDADFSNDGAVGSEDYAFLVDGWLSTSECLCTMSLTGSTDERRSQPRSLPVGDRLTATADLNGDRRVDWRDVELFELRHGLSGELSRAMRQ
ncbi:HYR domain-containing protein [Engelhardtia mirabilis]|uniref:HYR domain protein n=1 Tax=Engelhardtia mirabilis TaxID=2528011 RepID=A0A518BQZ6_9BACT|nr:HYR domain protein [Planctomycetes bacterium Pla133]QDV03696.1 HYR domain protein [Planctomycetes bacterium Pla86]